MASPVRQAISVPILQVGTLRQFGIGPNQVWPSLKPKANLPQLAAHSHVLPPRWVRHTTLHPSFGPGGLHVLAHLWVLALEAALLFPIGIRAPRQLQNGRRGRVGGDGGVPGPSSPTSSIFTPRRSVFPSTCPSAILCPAEPALGVTSPPGTPPQAGSWRCC